MTKIKICGITRAEDAAVCDEQGADFLGFIFVRESPRYVQPEQAARIETRAKRVGVFRDARIDEIRRTAEIARLDVIQLHGSETDDVVQALALPVIRALRVEDRLPETTSSADWLMFDSGGGTGRRFDWALLQAYERAKPFFLAGGITPENVAVAISKVRPDAVDVSSGVEREPGVKDHDKLRRLFERVRR